MNEEVKKNGNTILIKRGAKENVAKTTLMVGELAVALDTQELYIGTETGAQLIKGAASGVVESASKLDVEREIKLTGDATGSVDFDGSKDVEIAVALAKSGVTAGTYSKVTVDDRGIITAASDLEISDLPTITIADIDGLQDALDDKANNSSVYSKTDIDNKLDVKADADDLEALESAVESNTSKLDTLDSIINGTPADDETGAEAIPGLVNKVADLEDAIENASSADEIAEALKPIEEEIYGTTADDETGTEAVKGIKDRVADLEKELSEVITEDEVDSKISTAVSSVYRYKSSVADESELPTEDLTVGDVYNLEDTGVNVAWTGTEWDKLGATVDLSGYLTSDNAETTYFKISDADDYLKKDDAETTYLKKDDAIDAYTKTEVDDLLDDKADSATTISGYGITDAYTKTEVDDKLTEELAKKIGTTDVIDGGTF